MSTTPIRSSIGGGGGSASLHSNTNYDTNDGSMLICFPLMGKDSKSSSSSSSASHDLSRLYGTDFRSNRDVMNIVTNFQSALQSLHLQVSPLILPIRTESSFPQDMHPCLSLLRACSLDALVHLCEDVLPPLQSSLFTTWNRYRTMLDTVKTAFYEEIRKEAAISNNTNSMNQSSAGLFEDDLCVFDWKEAIRNFKWQANTSLLMKSANKVILPFGENLIPGDKKGSGKESSVSIQTPLSPLLANIAGNIQTRDHLVATNMSKWQSLKHEAAECHKRQSMPWWEVPLELANVNDAAQLAGESQQQFPLLPKDLKCFLRKYQNYLYLSTTPASEALSVPSPTTSRPGSPTSFSSSTALSVVLFVVPKADTSSKFLDLYERLLLSSQTESPTVNQGKVDLSSCIKGEDRDKQPTKIVTAGIVPRSAINLPNAECNNAGFSIFRVVVLTGSLPFVREALAKQPSLHWKMSIVPPNIFSYLDDTQQEGPESPIQMFLQHSMTFTQLLSSLAVDTFLDALHIILVSLLAEGILRSGIEHDFVVLAVTMSDPVPSSPMLTSSSAASAHHPSSSSSSYKSKNHWNYKLKKKILAISHEFMQNMDHSNNYDSRSSNYTKNAARRLLGTPSSSSYHHEDHGEDHMGGGDDLEPFVTFEIRW